MPPPPVNFNSMAVSAIEYTLERAEEDQSIMKTLFNKLLQSDVDPEFMQNYCGAIKKKFVTSGENPFGPTVMCFNEFAKACLANGLVENMLTISENLRPDPRCAIAGYQALDSIAALVRRGTLAERRDLMDQLLKHNILEVCQTKLGHPLCIHRNVAVTTLRSLASDGFMGEKISALQASDIIVAMARHTLAGPESYVDEMKSSTTSWQSQMFMGTTGIPSAQSAKYVPRYYAMNQESATWTAHGLLCRDPPPKKSFCLAIVQENPEIFDLLLQCATLPRPPWYPETQADATACETFCCLLQFPLDLVPGVAASYADDAMKAEATAEWQAMVDLIKIFVSRPGWVEAVVAIWTKVDDEKWSTIQPVFNRVKKDYLAQQPPDQDAFLQTFEHRGTLRISMLRTIATMTYAAQECGINDASLVSLLRLAYLGSGKIVALKDINLNDDGARFTYVERAEEIFRSPMYTVDSNEKVIEAPAQLSPESIGGPTALIRLLTVLAQRGTLNAIANWTALPPGTSSSTSLGQVKQITSPDVVRRCVTLSRKRVTARREVGNKRKKQGEADFACPAYMSAAELAAALIAFNEASKGAYDEQMRGVYQELVMCLGEASQMALDIGLYRKALNLAGCAVKAAASIPAGESVDGNLKKKNLQRVDIAKSKLKL